MSLTLDVIVACVTRILGAPSSLDDLRALWRDRAAACGVIVEHANPLAPTQAWVLAAYWGDPVSRRFEALSIFPLAPPLSPGAIPRHFTPDAAARRAAEELGWTVLAPTARHLSLVSGAPPHAER